MFNTKHNINVIKKMNKKNKIMNKINKIKLHKFTPSWLAGFTQSDGSFMVAFEQVQKGKLAIRPRPVFNLSQSIRDLEMMKALHHYLGCGSITINRGNVVINVSAINDWLNKIFPILDNTPLRGNKLLSYNILKIVTKMMEAKEHLNLEGLLKIMDISYFMNKNTTYRTQESYQELLDILISKHGSLPKFLPITLTNLTDIPPLNGDYIRGEIDGDGSFNVAFRKTRRRIGINFTIVHELESISILNELVKFFNCGKVYKLSSSAAVRFQIQNVSEILNNVYPIFQNMEFNSIKQEQFKKFITICEIINTKGYKSNIDLKTIVDLGWDMNQDGKYRRWSKEEYVKKFT